MEIYTIFFYWKCKYCEDDYATQSNLQIQCNVYQTTNGIFHKTTTKKFQFSWEYKRTQRAKVTLRKKNGTRGINLPEFRLYYKATVIRIVWYWHKDSNVGQWNKIESQEINPSLMVTLSLTKKEYTMEKKGPLQ